MADERTQEHRYIEVRMWLDVTGSGHVTQQRLDQMVAKVRDTAVDALAGEGVKVTNLGGDWVYYYSQRHGFIDPPRPGRRR